MFFGYECVWGVYHIWIYIHKSSVYMHAAWNVVKHRRHTTENDSERNESRRAIEMGRSSTREQKIYERIKSIMNNACFQCLCCLIRGRASFRIMWTLCSFYQIWFWLIRQNMSHSLTHTYQCTHNEWTIYRCFKRSICIIYESIWIMKQAFISYQMKKNKNLSISNISIILSHGHTP